MGVGLIGLVDVGRTVTVELVEDMQVCHGDLSRPTYYTSLLSRPVLTNTRSSCSRLGPFPFLYVLISMDWLGGT